MKKTITLEFILNSREEISPGEFTSLFQCVDVLSRCLVEMEVLNILEVMKCPSEERLTITSSLHSKMGKRVPTPAEVKSIDKGSWKIVIAISFPLIFWFLKNFVGKTIIEAWEKSDVRNSIANYIRDHAFGGAKQNIEMSAARKRNFGNLRVIDTKELKESTPEEQKYAIRLERHKILEISLSDKELMEEFIKKIKV